LSESRDASDDKSDLSSVGSEHFRDEEDGSNAVPAAATTAAEPAAAETETKAPTHTDDVMDVVPTSKRDGEEASGPPKAKKARKSKDGDDDEYLPDQEAKDYDEDEEMLDVDEDMAQDMFSLLDGVEDVSTGSGQVEDAKSQPPKSTKAKQ
jgi:hypothetical protein